MLRFIFSSLLFAMLLGFAAAPAAGQGYGPPGGGAEVPWDLINGAGQKVGTASYGTASAATAIGGTSQSWGYVSGDRITVSKWEAPNGDIMECNKIGGTWHVKITRAGSGAVENYTLN